MAKKDIAARFKSAAAAGRRQARQATAMVDQERDIATEAMRIVDIKARAAGDLRALNAGHVVLLAESVHALGLLEPIVVDRRGRLVAGGHRLAACRLLALTEPRERRDFLLGLFGLLDIDPTASEEPRLTPTQQTLVGRVEPVDWPSEPADDHPDDHPPRVHTHVPVRRLSFDAEKSPSDALAAEVAENEQRRDYTRREVQDLAARLRASGFKDTRGRPKAGQRALTPTLEAILGKSRRTVQRLLSEEEAEINAPNGAFIERKALARIKRSLDAYLSQASRPRASGERRELYDQIKALARRLP